MAKITIDGVEYDTDAMTDDAKAQLTSIQFCENELRRLQAEASSLQTARNAYAIALKAELAKGSSSKAREPETVATPPNETSDKTEKKGFLGGLFGKK